MHKWFIFQEDIWLGQGWLNYTHVKENLPFNTRWEIKEISPTIYQAKHRVEIEGAQESHQNIYTFTQVDETKFEILLQNPIVGPVTGAGTLHETQLNWHFQASDFEGYETYTMVDQDHYTLIGEYFSHEISSKIQGKLWRKFQLQ